MARTKASVGAKVSIGKSSKARCSVAAPPINASSTAGEGERSSRNYSGGNPVCPRETPAWQKPITRFFITNNKDSDDENEAPESSKSKPKCNVIESDEEDEMPKSTVLDESMELETLTGEKSHKIDEYYNRNNKGKGKGKKTNKGSVSDTKRNEKRDLEDITFGEDSEHMNKKIKVK